MSASLSPQITLSHGGAAEVAFDAVEEPFEAEGEAGVLPGRRRGGEGKGLHDFHEQREVRFPAALDEQLGTEEGPLPGDLLPVDLFERDAPDVAVDEQREVEAPHRREVEGGERRQSRLQPAELAGPHDPGAGADKSAGHTSE